MKPLDYSVVSLVSRVSRKHEDMIAITHLSMYRWLVRTLLALSLSSKPMAKRRTPQLHCIAKDAYFRIYRRKYKPRLFLSSSSAGYWCVYQW